MERTNPKEGIVLFSAVEGAIGALYRERIRKWWCTIPHDLHDKCEGRWTYNFFEMSAEDSVVDLNGSRCSLSLSHGNWAVKGRVSMWGMARTRATRSWTKERGVGGGNVRLALYKWEKMTSVSYQCGEAVGVRSDRDVWSNYEQALGERVREQRKYFQIC